MTTNLASVYVALIALGALAITAFSVNQIDMLLLRRKRPLAEQPSRHIHDRLVRWTYDRGFGVKKVSTDKYDFEFVIRDQQDRPITVIKAKGADEIVIGMAFEPSRLFPWLQGVEATRRRQLVSDLKVLIARQELTWLLLSDLLGPVQIQAEVPTDAITGRAAFFSLVDKVRLTMVMILETIRALSPGALEVVALADATTPLAPDSAVTAPSATS